MAQTEGGKAELICQTETYSLLKFEIEKTSEKVAFVEEDFCKKVYEEIERRNVAE